MGLVELRFEGEDALDAGEVEAELSGHLLDPAQALDVVLGVEARALRRAARLNQPARLVHAERLRVHLGELGGDRDHEDAAVERDIDALRPDTAGSGLLAHGLTASKRRLRGLPFIVLARASTALVWSSSSSFGSSMTKR